LTQLAEIVDRLARDIGPLAAEPTPLEGGITNHNFRARFGDEDVVIRLPGKDTDQLGVDRAAERDAGEAAGRVGVGPEVIALIEDPPCLVTRFIEGDPVSSEKLRDRALLAEIATALRAVHGAGPLQATFSPFRVVEQYAERASARGAAIPPDYDWAHESAGRVEAAMTGVEHGPALCHNDLLAANFLRTADGIRIVDWEYAGIGDRFFDLGNLAVNNGFDAGNETALLEEYFGEEYRDDRLACLRLMRFMSDFREAMWGVMQSSLSDLDFDFGAYADEHFMRMRTAAADPSFETWIEEADAAG
jgi:thiamine kinase-like enzyme